MRTVMHSRGGLRSRAGFTLIEMLITLLMFSVVGGAIIGVLNSQQRFARAASHIAASRTQMQTANLVLPSELRMLSPSDKDILEITASSIRMQSTIATAVVCARAGKVITVEPVGPLAGYMFMPVPGDSAFIWDDRTQSATDDTWRSSNSNRAYAITAVNTAASCATPVADGLATTATYSITISDDTPLWPTVDRGAPIRITRQVRYGLYQSAADNEWYLGYQDPVLTTYQYVAGPFRSNADGGLRLAYYTSSDIEITSANFVAKRDSVARVEIATRVQSSGPLSMSGTVATTPFQDSLKVAVSLRNRVDH